MKNNRRAIFVWGVVCLAAVAAVFGLRGFLKDRPEESILGSGYLNASYSIEGQTVRLKDGYAETEAAPGSAAQTITRYFGNDLAADLDGDGTEDRAFILTQSSGGSGTFYYAVAALHKENGYVGTDGYLLGDRIAPQSTNVSQNPRHVRVVVFNYADRAPGEPMSAHPSVGASAYLKVDPESMRWAVVAPDFEGEAR